MKIKAVNTILYCRKWQETVAFYRDGIKLLVLSSNDWFKEFKLNEIARLSVADASHTSIKSGDGKGITISLQVADLEQMRTDLVVAGIEPSPVKEVWGSKAMYVRALKATVSSFGRNGQRLSAILDLIRRECICEQKKVSATFYEGFEGSLPGGSIFRAPNCIPYL